MDQAQEAVSKSAPTPEIESILINDMKYSYSITKSESNEESLLIKLFEPNQKSNMYFTYEAPMEQLTKEVKFLAVYESLDEIIDNLKDIFSQGNVHVEEKDGVYSLELKVIGIKKTFIIQLTKHEIEKAKEPINENGSIESKLNKLENNYKDLFNKYEELKVIRKNEIKDIVKEVIFDNDIKLKLCEEIKQMLSSSSNSKSIPKNKDDSKTIENNIMNKVKEVVNNKEDKINNQINIIQKQLNENINYLNNIKSNNNNNYIILQVKIDEEDLNKDIRLFYQASTYKYYYNFERDDIETIIDNQIVNIKYKNMNSDYKYDKKSKNCELSQNIKYNLNIEYYYYWNFTTTGIHTIKIIFKKKLLQCNYLFSNCTNIYKIDCSNFDCSQIIDCSFMFYYSFSVYSSIIEINLGKLDFALSNNFSYMFYGCNNLEKLDVSYFNTNNSKSFEGMFYKCSKLKEINVSKFKTTNCENINSMFSCCSSLESIDMLNWDMKNINDIDYLFSGCKSLKNIKMNFNNNKNLSFKYTFNQLPEGGSFIWKKGINCNELLKHLPVSWNRTQE